MVTLFMMRTSPGDERN